MFEYATREEESMLQHMFVRSVLIFMSSMQLILRINYPESSYIFILNQFQWSGFVTHVLHRADSISATQKKTLLIPHNQLRQHIYDTLQRFCTYYFKCSIVSPSSILSLRKNTLKFSIGVAHFIKRRQCDIVTIMEWIV